MFHLHTMKREKIISKFYSDENVSISFKTYDKSNKIRVTFFPVDKNKPDSVFRTLSGREELMQLVEI